MNRAQLQRDRDNWTLQAMREGRIDSPSQQRCSIPDKHRLQQAVDQGEMRLRSGVNGIGQRLSIFELEATRKAIEDSRSRLTEVLIGEKRDCQINKR
jgi:hypothetical protein